MCVQDSPVESEDTGLPDTVLSRNITVIFATLVARTVAKYLHALFVDLPPDPWFLPLSIFFGAVTSPVTCSLVILIAVQ
jgi:hypothetical protein